MTVMTAENVLRRGQTIFLLYDSIFGLILTLICLFLHYASCKRAKSISFKIHLIILLEFDLHY